MKSIVLEQIILPFCDQLLFFRYIHIITFYFPVDRLWKIKKTKKQKENTG